MVAEFGDGLIARSKVLEKVLSVVGVVVERPTTLLLVVLAEEAYVVGSCEVCNDNFGRLLGGIWSGLGGKSPLSRGRAAEAQT